MLLTLIHSFPSLPHNSFHANLSHLSFREEHAPRAVRVPLRRLGGRRANRGLPCQVRRSPPQLKASELRLVCRLYAFFPQLRRWRRRRRQRTEVRVPASSLSSPTPSPLASSAPHPSLLRPRRGPAPSVCLPPHRPVPPRAAAAARPPSATASSHRAGGRWIPFRRRAGPPPTGRIHRGHGSKDEAEPHGVTFSWLRILCGSREKLQPQLHTRSRYSFERLAGLRPEPPWSRTKPCQTGLLYSLARSFVQSVSLGPSFSPRKQYVWHGAGHCIIVSRTFAASAATATREGYVNTPTASTCLALTAPDCVVKYYLSAETRII
jgi:hypothetical protein